MEGFDIQDVDMWLNRYGESLKHVGLVYWRLLGWLVDYKLHFNLSVENQLFNELIIYK